mmetsp:Transcript_26937/g.59160  ORF Transcript_26937/g.59160 Transcript_26937/m.59160 type:complete len:103 (-) Transcript_26937:703-1011(-)|eukprot:CAMPEP_0168194694 /NCGR_PEP_ID=MMETSP0139_2-20121125/19392_1 /TAXON_ID=44445 /ORGANISM="Pseudo-nitzschia australis, Strain 10249 10 AB" /LENGTH=102 /DNA_ID=CAMNT_0008118365 /DNA_START=133 /DNA_END=441 /DNA_ORIENTATION=-
MNPRRQRRSRRGGGKTNLDDLDGALTSMIGSQQQVKLTVDPSEERRFTMHSSNDANDSGRGVFADSMINNNKDGDASGGSFTHTSTFEKHQVNYSATKYIKP